MTKSKDLNKPHYLGHRKRLREKIIKGGSLADYEVLELLLFSIFPQKDVKQIAKTLIEECGGFQKIFFTDYKKLSKIEGIGDSTIATLFAVKDILQRILHEEIKEKENITLNGIKEILNYLRLKIGKNFNESFCVLYLDKEMKLIGEEAQDHGTIDKVAIYSREIIKNAIDLGATNLIISHNHPSGDPKPSKADIDFTLQLKVVCKNIGMNLVDHIIVTSEKAHFSFLKRG